MAYDDVCDVGGIYTKSCWPILILVSFILLKLLRFDILGREDVSCGLFRAVMLPTFERNILPSSSGMNMEAVCS
jgi:hypothetical protein